MYGLGRAHLRSVVEVTDDDGCVRRLDICGPEQTIAGETTRQQMNSVDRSASQSSLAAASNFSCTRGISRHRLDS